MTGEQIKTHLIKEGITPSTVQHRGENRIKLIFKNTARLTDAVRQLPGRKWSKTMQAWHIPRDKKLLEQLLSNLTPGASLPQKAGQAPERGVETPAQNKNIHLLPWQEKKIDYAPVVIIEARSPAHAGQRAETSKAVNRNKFPTPPPELYAYLQKLVDKAKLKGYSPNTIRNYRHHFHTYLLAVYGIKDIDRITKDEIEKYLRWRQRHHTYSENDQNQHINAIKFYYEQVLGRERMLFNLPRPFKPKQLPAVWAEEDVLKMLKTQDNLKHKTMLLMAYAHGMRVSELSSLKLADMDSKRMQIHIKAGKGKKDRVVNLSETALEVMRVYYKEYHPKVYLFENDLTHEPITTRTMQRVFEHAKKKAHLIKKAGIHSLRHSYATHLHEQGVDIKFLKELLGHSSLRTTETYTHVSKKDISKIHSPIDRLKL